MEIFQFNQKLLSISHAISCRTKKEKKKKNTFQNYLEEKRMFFSIGKSDETSYRLKNQIEKIEIAEEPDS